MFERLIYTNSAGQSIEMSTQSDYYVNLRKDVSGLNDVNVTIYRTQVVNADGSIETGYQQEERPIDIVGTIRDRANIEQLTHELQRVFSPYYTGVLRFEGETCREIGVRSEKAPKITSAMGKRLPEFTLSLVALNPNWRDTAALTKAIASAGTSIYYGGSRACGMRITITANADAIDMQTLTLTNGSTAETITFRTGGGVLLNTGDVLVIDIKQLGIDITLNGVNALERIDFTNTVFPNLYPGNNTISWLAHGDESQFAVSVAYTPLYLGK